MNGILHKAKDRYRNRKEEEMSLTDYFELCSKDPSAYSSASERLLTAIGEPEIVDTSKVPRLSRMFLNRKIKVYPAFKEFYGMEEAVEQIVSYLRHSGQGLEERKQILYLLGPVGGGKCLAAGTKIAMKDGSYRNIENVRAGDMVLSHTNGGEKIFKEVTQAFALEPKQHVRIKTKRGLEIEGAATHKLYTAQGWTPIAELREGELLAMANEHTFGGTLTDNMNLVNMYAYLIGDGNTATYKNTVQFAVMNETLLNDFTSICNNMDINHRHYPEQGNVQLSGEGKNKLLQLLERDGLKGKYSYEKTIPEFITKLPQEQLSEFLSRLFATDGWASVSYDTSRVKSDGNYVCKKEIGYCSTSKELAYQVQSLLRKYGISSGVHSKHGVYKGVTHRLAYTVSITESDSLIAFANKIGIIGKEAAVQAVLEEAKRSTKIGTTGRVIPKQLAIEATENVGCSKFDGTTRIKDMIRTTLNGQETVSRNLVKKLHTLTDGGEDLAKLLDQNYFWDTIKSIEYLDKVEPMYDFTVEGWHNYVANGFISHNSSLAERLKELMETQPIYVLKSGDQISPLCESPFGLFDSKEDGPAFKEKYNIHARAFRSVASPWAVKRLREFDGDYEQFTVVKMWPSRLNQIGVTKTEPGDENNQDISSLVGKVDIRKLEDFSQDDPDAYSYKGGLNLATQGLLEFVEMFKAPIKMLHPLLTATQEGNYNGTQGFGAMPFQGVILAHSNESEWEQFRNNRTNEAFLDRVCIVKVPYCLRIDEEVKIYNKLLANSELSNAACAPGTLEMMAEFSVLSRLKKPENSTMFSKMRVYNGEDLKDVDPKAKSLQEYRDAAGVDEGMRGLSTRFAYKILSRVFNYDTSEVAANPIHLMYVLEKEIEQQQFPPETEDVYLSYIKGILAPKYAEFIGEEIQRASIESLNDLGQNIFDKYVMFADHWIQDTEYRDHDTGEQYDRNVLNSELEKIEKPFGLSNPKDFRNEVVNFVLRARANNKGKNPNWTSYEKMRSVIEKKLFASTEDLLPIIGFGTKKSTDEERKHVDFVSRMIKRGYTEKQVRLVVEWYNRHRRHS